METISDYISTTKNIDIITSQVRERLGRQIVQQILGENDKLYVMTLSPEIEEALVGSMQETEFGFVSNLGTDIKQLLLNDLTGIVERVGYAVSPVVVTGMQIRSLVRNIVESQFPKVSVISYEELVAGQVKVEHLGVLSGKTGEEEETIA